MAFPILLYIFFSLFLVFFIFSDFASHPEAPPEVGAVGTAGGLTGTGFPESLVGGSYGYTYIRGCSWYVAIFLDMTGRR